MDNGVLSLRIPVSEASKPRRVTLGSTGAVSPTEENRTAASASASTSSSETDADAAVR